MVWHFLPHHYNEPFGVIEQFFVPTGVSAVIFFFVLSGYLITGILLHDKENSDNKLLVVKNFIIRRTLRIFPIYFLLLFIVILLGFPFQDDEKIYQATFTSNIFVFRINDWPDYIHTWSLAVEEQFYLAWPWLILFLPGKHHKYLFASCIIIAILSFWYFGGSNDLLFGSPRTAITTTNLAAFGVGGFYASLIRTDRGNSIINGSIWYLALISLVLIYYWKICPYFNWPLVFPYLRIFAVSLVSIAIIHRTILMKNGYFYSLFIDNGLVTKLGKISYGSYLYHVPVLYFFKHHLMIRVQQYGFTVDPYLWCPIFCIVVFGIANISYELIEKPILNYKERFSIERS
jgi:peptidoglycan/LPS O-acetylase OafA/YrhL